MAESWICIDGVKYDVSAFMDKHPGGKDLLAAYLGMPDASAVFTEFHQPSTRAFLKTLPVLEASPPASPTTPSSVSEEGSAGPSRSASTSSLSSFETDVTALRAELMREGRFTASVLFYARKLLELCALLALGTYLMSIGSWTVAALVTGVFYQQSGWLAHDFAHNQVTKRHRKLFGMITGPLCQGFTVTWWVTKHMTHHALPNALHEETGAACDTDIDMAPLFYFTARLMPRLGEQSIVAKLWTRYQGYMLWVALPFSKFAWDYGSTTTAISRGAKDELLGVAAHYAFFFAQAYYFTQSLAGALAFCVAARLVAGFLLGWVFIMSHSGLEYYDRPDVPFYSAQVKTTRNMSLDLFTTWFTGGLNYQIEHHLFPRMPRHQFSAVCGRVQALCERHGLAYEVSSIVAISTWLTRYLNSVPLVGQAPAAAHSQASKKVL